MHPLCSCTWPVERRNRLLTLECRLHSSTGRTLQFELPCNCLCRLDDHDICWHMWSR